ncbi:hypothetical protein [Desulfovibrio ferrophilus]|uniref:Uncharacterized protein n=1 Tax=Desulfovibrio ferrophilus TaxID=241368 RepID=A0A2Z6B389_9BACT|nr:hypothetical protein [Desulfovibrio ferrophilus]BBD09908.1 uncharacterized protein DFE_3182 [Desulfovibrio ferrophilus]
MQQRFELIEARTVGHDTGQNCAIGDVGSKGVDPPFKTYCIKAPLQYWSGALSHWGGHNANTLVRVETTIPL